MHFHLIGLALDYRIRNWISVGLSGFLIGWMGTDPLSNAIQTNKLSARQHLGRCHRPSTAGGDVQSRPPTFRHRLSGGLEDLAGNARRSLTSCGLRRAAEPTVHGLGEPVMWQGQASPGHDAVHDEYLRQCYDYHHPAGCVPRTRCAAV
jgi:hypothetical protein